MKDLYTRAASAYAEANRSQVAAESLMKCAKALETHDAKVQATLPAGINSKPPMVNISACQFCEHCAVVQLLY